MFASTLTVTRRAVGGQDEYGNDTFTETTFTVPRCEVQPAKSTEDTSGRQHVVAWLNVWAPPTPRVLVGDQVTYDDLPYEVDGEVGRWVDGSRLDHQEFALRRVTG